MHRRSVGILASGLAASGIAALAGAPQLLNPWVKAQVGNLGPVGFGVVAGAQIPEGTGIEHNLAAEGVAIVPLSKAWTMDLDLGLGRSFLTPATLGHGLIALYDALPGGRTLLVEASVQTTTAAGPTWFQHVGLQVPVTSQFSVDGSVGLLTQVGAGSTLVPQVGLTFTP